MKLVLLSDTHTLHEHLVVPPCDVLIHAGDFCGKGTAAEAADFLDWFAQQPARHHVLVAGNHDRFCEQDPTGFRQLFYLTARRYAVRSMHYLQGSGVTIDGHKIWGSPITPTYFDWSFMCDRGEEIADHWDRIPLETSILVTHGPPLGVGDRNRMGEPVGCADLLRRVSEVAPKLHVFGHVHEGFGMYYDPDLGTQFVNAAMLSADHERLHRPVEVEL